MDVLSVVRTALMIVMVLAVLGAARPTFAQAPSYKKWYLAEGATGLSADFLEEILIANPGAQDTRVRITFLLNGAGAPIVHELTVKATSRATVRVNDIPGLAAAQVSAVVESLDDVDIVVERTMSWSRANRRGAHNSIGTTTPATSWFLAEGSTGYFNAFVLIANPDTTQAARVRVKFLEPGGGVIPYKPPFPVVPGGDEFEIAPQRRYNIWANNDVPELKQGKAFSVVVESLNGVGIIAERAMYWNNVNQWEGGHNSIGVSEPSLTWFFAEGTTKGSPSLAFDTFLLLANPNALPARAKVSFFTAPGTPPVEREYPLPAFSRVNVWTNKVPELVGKDFGIEVESVVPTGGGAAQPIVAERAVYWGPQTSPPSPNWIDGHNTPGMTAEATKWVFAEGIEDGFADVPAGIRYDTYFLLSNSSSVDIPVQATFVREDGTGIVRQVTIPAESRLTVAGFQYAELTNQRFAAFFEATNAALFVAERAVYWGAGYFAGHASTGVPWAGSIATPPPVPPAAAVSITPTQGPAGGGTPVTITGTNFRNVPTTVTIGGVAATGVAVANATTLVATTGARPATADATVDVVVVNAGAASTLAGAYTYKAPPTISGATPLTGPSSGGTVVTITGTNFSAGATVQFGGVAATNVTFVNSTQLQATAPPWAMPFSLSSVNVSVTLSTPSGMATAPQPFTYVAFTNTDTILAFGDSITVGVTSITCEDPFPMSGATCVQTVVGYRQFLRSALAARYPQQTLTVRNGGVSGEVTADGRNRLPGTIDNAAPPSDDLVIILEGVNDPSPPRVTETKNNLRSMVNTALDRGKRVILGTLTPVREWRVEQRDLAQARSLAIRELYQDYLLDPLIAARIALADFELAFGSNNDLISVDGLHPTTEGYQVMANLLYNIIVDRFEAGQ